MRLDRRGLIKTAGSLAIFTGLTSRPVFGRSLAGYPFTLGVASGDPHPDGFVLWTRLAPNPLERGSGMPMQAVPVQWQVAEDEHFTRIVHSGEEMARPELGHSVHAEVGGLRPARRYWYRFLAGGEASPVGTVRSAPAAAAAVDQLRIGVAGCQNYEAGYFTAYRHLSEEPDLDAVFHYGDYIYEHVAGRVCPKGEGGERTCFRSHVGDEIYSLDDYRRRYAQYKMDPDLQAAHAAAAFLSTWDDHEVDNNWVDTWDEQGTPPEMFLLRRYAAMQAWYENMPVRRAQFPAHGGLRMHRRLDYGRLLRIHLLDTRQHRTDQRCGLQNTTHCRPAEDTAPSQMLGAEQEAWLTDGMSADFGWNLLAQQVMMMPFLYPESRADGRHNFDSWSGYSDARARVLEAIGERGLTNVVVATGDVHKHHAGVVPMNEDDLDGPAAATEYVATSISSGGDGSDVPKGWGNVLSDNPHTRLLNDRRGYQVFTIGKDEWRTDVVGVDRVTTPGGAKTKIATLVTVPQKPGVHPA
ncbi:alkaline phosphatase D family protein [Altererythrobacter sp. C41]|uniref:alkaline phosphatase D family protein n=1 Tax=Altererythrobacter sp. C41 TaxID=2806021 RepID=UPI00193480A2|nr:alkaline phosphatase D family protein [Altererythrobacter sp. C41]MBM0170367.1 alkaline phosphatase D family protein [Altererythrobacter sp. C41]